MAFVILKEGETMKFIDLDATDSYLLDGRYIVYPPRRGHWVKNEEGDYHCSECKAIVESDEKSRHYWVYCYHCGAKMDEVIEEKWTR